MNVTGAKQAEAPIEVPLSRGGLVYGLLRILRMRPESGHAERTAFALAMVTWLPPLLLAIPAHLAIGGQVALPFLKDITAFARFLVATPLLILAGPAIDVRLSAAIKRLVQYGVIPAARRADFDSAIARLKRGCESWVPDLVMLAVVWTVAWFDVTQGERGSMSSWVTAGASGELSAAGWWYSVVSLPVFGVLALRWLWRLFLWARFLKRLSRLDLALIPTHPDQAGGLGGLAEATIGFNVVVAALSVTLGAGVAARILYAGETLDNSKLVIGAFVVVCAILFLGPLLVFSGPLGRARFQGLLTYGDLATDYVRAFDRKWVRKAVRSVPDGERSQDSGETLLGSGDVQSLADIGGSFERVVKMKPLLITPRLAIILAASALLPMLPPLSAVVPIVEILGKLAQMMTR